MSVATVLFIALHWYGMGLLPSLGYFLLFHTTDYPVGATLAWPVTISIVVFKAVKRAVLDIMS
jgi:hypothetical protein